MNVFEALSQSDEWMSESEILKQVEYTYEVLTKILDTLMHYRLVDYRIDDKFEYFYRLAGYRKKPARQEQPSKKTLTIPTNIL